MRYCPKCKREVNSHFTGGQLLIMLILFACGIIPGVIYAMVHTKKCPICGARTMSHRPIGSRKEEN